MFNGLICIEENNNEYMGTTMKLSFSMKVGLSVLVVVITAVVVINLGIRNKAMYSDILPYKHNITDIIIQSKDTIVLLGYKDVASGLPVFKYIPQVLRSTNGGLSWEEIRLDTIILPPTYYQVDNTIFLYAFERDFKSAKVYASSDVGTTWRFIGSHMLPELSLPIFGEFLRHQQSADNLRSVSICEEWDCSNVKTITPLIIAQKIEKKLSNEVGFVDLHDGHIKRIPTGKYQFSEAIFAENNIDWILGRIEGDHGIFLIRNNKGSVELVAHWPNKTDIKFGGDQPQALFVKGNLIAVAVAGAPFYGTGYLYYSLDGGINWIEKELSTSSKIQIAVKEDGQGLLVVCVNMMSVSIFDIPFQIDLASPSK